MAARPGSVGLLEALKMAQARYDAEQAKKPATPFDFGETVRGADKAIQQGVFGLTDAIAGEGKRLIDGKFGFEALADSLPQLAQSGPQNIAEALGTQRGGWTANDLQAQRDRGNMGEAAGGALDASMLLPAVGAAKGAGKIAGDVLGDASSVVARGVRKLGYEPIPNQNALGVFGGPLAKTADHKALDTAKQMWRDGKPRETILNDTGWFQGRDGKWRFEIDDSGARVNEKAAKYFESEGGTRGKASSIFEHDALYKAYPQLKNNNVYIAKGAEDSGGFMGDGQGWKPKIETTSPTLERAIPIALHENQHAIQQIENFALGGNLADDEAYKRIAGEVEARNVMTRQNMTAEQRRAAPPWLTQDRPDDVQTLNFFGGVEPQSRLTSPTTLGMGFPFSGKDGEKPLLSALMDAMRGKPPPGGGAAAKTVEEQAPPGAFFAYHGSPHDFDRFDLSKIGSGEGAQAYGRGLYFAESPKTGQAYRDAMLFDAIQGVKDPARREAALVLHRNNWNVSAAQKELGRGATPEQIKMLSDVAENPPGGLYKVKIDADPNAFKEFEAPPTEAEIQAMKEAGIPGLKYFDNGSRASEKGTRNFVVFDDKLVNIAEKNGKPFTPRNPLDQFTPPTSLDDIFTGGAPRSPRELTGGSQAPAGLEGSYFNDPRFGNGAQDAVPYTEGQGFGGLDARLGQQKPLGYDDWAPEWKAAHDKGLPMDQASRMARAREQGFNVDERLFHGTWDDRNMDFDAFDPLYRLGESSQERASWFTPDTKAAGMFAHHDSAGGEQIMPVFVKGNIKKSDMRGKPYSGEEMPWNLRVAEKNGFDGVRFKNMVESKEMATTKSGVSPKDSKTLRADQVAIFDPANIRSVNAAFDPANAGKNSLLGMGAPFEGKGGGLAAILGGEDVVQFNAALEQLKSASHGDVKSIAKKIGVNANADKAELLLRIEDNFWKRQHLLGTFAEIDKRTDPKWAAGFDDRVTEAHANLGKKPTDLGAGSPFDSDLIKLLMAYGAFGGMSAGALATMDAQKQQGNGF